MVNIVTKENTTSPIWTQETNKESQCLRTAGFIEHALMLYQQKEVLCQNLVSHLKPHHPAKYNEVAQAMAANKASNITKKRPIWWNGTANIGEYCKKYKQNGLMWQGSQMQ